MAGAAEPVGDSLHDAHEKDAFPLIGDQVREVGGGGGALESKITSPEAFSTRTEPEELV